MDSWLVLTSLSLPVGSLLCLLAYSSDPIGPWVDALGPVPAPRQGCAGIPRLWRGWLHFFARASGPVFYCWLSPWFPQSQPLAAFGFGRLPRGWAFSLAVWFRPSFLCLGLFLLVDGTSASPILGLVIRVEVVSSPTLSSSGLGVAASPYRLCLWCDVWLTCLALSGLRWWVTVVPLPIF